MARNPHEAQTDQPAAGKKSGGKAKTGSDENDPITKEPGGGRDYDSVEEEPENKEASRDY